MAIREPVGGAIHPCPPYSVNSFLCFSVKTRRMTGLVRTDLPWMLATREERVAALRGWFESRGDKMAAAHAAHRADEPIANLMGNCAPVFEELGRGATVSQLAERWGVSPVTIYEYLIAHAPDRWAAFSAASSLGRMAKADESLEGAEDSVEVAKWSQIGRNAQWNLERMAPRLYGAKQGSEGVNIVVNIDRTCGGSVVIDGGVVSDSVAGAGTEASASREGA